MATRRGAAVLIAIGGLSLAAMNVTVPRRELANADTAPLLGPVYAPPVEQIESHELRRGETLSGVLSRMSIADGDLTQLLLVLRESVNPRSLSEGSEITVRRWASNQQPRAVDVRLNRDSTIRVARDENYGWS